MCILKALRLLLYPFSMLYGAIMEMRNHAFRSGLKKSVKFDIPVVSVGNLSVGGSGKTPMIKYLISQLQKDYTIGVLSRGYGRDTTGYHLVETTSEAQKVGDEPLEIKWAFPGATVAVCESRVLGIPQMLQDNESVDLVLLDDAFQHQYVKPSFSILMSTMRRPFYSDFVMPLGRLREFRKNYKRADIVVFNGSDFGFEPAIKLDIPYFVAHRENTRLAKVWGDANPIFDAPVVVSALANNAAFNEVFDREHPMAVIHAYRDHYRYTKREVRSFIEEAKNRDGVIITTAKDWVKLKPFFRESDKHVTVLVQEVGYTLPQSEAFLEMLKTAIDETS